MAWPYEEEMIEAFAFCLFLQHSFYSLKSSHTEVETREKKWKIVVVFFFFDHLCLFAFSPECAKELDIVIVLDGSNSIYPWSSILDFLLKFLADIEIGPQLSQVRRSPGSACH